MVTVNYGVRNVVAEFDATYSKFQDRLSDESDPHVVALADGGFAVAYRWESLEDVQDSVLVDFYNADGTRRFGEDWTTADTEVTGASISDLSATQLSSGALLVSWTDSDDSGIHYATVDPSSGRVLDEDSRLASTSSQDTNGRVAALLDGGGFALVKRNFSSSTDLDSDLLIYNRDGVLQGGVHALNDNSAVNEISPALAVLTSGVNKGAIVAAYAFEKVDGTFDYGMKVEIWNAAGQRVLSPFGFDTMGDVNVAPKVVALQDGGFAVAYLDDEYAVTSSMTVAFFDQNGNYRGKVRGDNDGVPDADISLTVLQNGYVLLTHTDDPDSSSNIRASLFDPAAMTRIMVLGAIDVQAGTQNDSSVAALKNGTFVTAWHDANSDLTDGNSDPDDSHVSIQIDTIVRFSIGDNTADTITGDVFVDEMYGRESGDTLKGMGGNDILSGEAGADKLDGGIGADKMDGGLDSDTYYVDNALDVVVEAVNGGISDWVATSVSYTLGAGVEVEVFSTTSSGATTAINLTGNEFAQTITGNAGNNKLDGKGGADTMKGLGGNDTYYVDNAGDKVVEGAGQGTADWVATSVSYTLGAGVQVEKFSTTSSGATTAIDLTGNEFAQAITGNAGANRLNGMGGADTMTGLGGNDTYYVDNAGDKVVEGAGQGTADWVATSISYTLGAGVQVEKLSTTNSGLTTALDLTGNEFAQAITGNAGANRLNGMGGADTMSGLGGNDTYYIDNAGDKVVEGAGQGTADWVATAISYALAAGVQVEKLSTTSSGGTAAINLMGNEFAQTITGNAGANLLTGKGGNDTLTGGAGADIFFFDTALSASGNVDRITDFNVAADTIRLENGIFTTIVGTGTLTAAQLVVDATGIAHDANDRIIYETDTGKLFYDSNGSAAGGSIQFATLTAGLALTNADFQIV